MQDSAATAFPGLGPGLIWGLAADRDGMRPLQSCDDAPDGMFQWLHLELVDQGTQRWIAGRAEYSEDVRDLLLSDDTHQRALIDDAVVALVLHDLERDFDRTDTTRTGAFRVALTPDRMVTCRLHPLASFDAIRTRLDRGGARDAAGALELLVGTICDRVGNLIRGLAGDVQRAEEAMLDEDQSFRASDLIGIRRRLAQLHRMMSGMRGVFHRLEEHDDLPEALLPSARKLSQRVHALDADILEIQGELRLLRDELDFRAAQRTNQNLYVLSVITALLLPATLVTGIFGMNTGGLPFAVGAHGTFYAILVSAGCAAATYALLRGRGLIRG